MLLGSLLAGAGLVLTAPATDAAVYIRTNTTPMTLTGGQAASTPEFTSLNVYGTGTTITDVNLVLTGLTHTNPDDLDIELVHAVTLSTSTAVALMSDVCGATNLSNVNLTLDDQAVNELPDSSACTSGTWQPNNVDSATDSFVVPVAGSALAAFNGAPATGQWGVYVRDDSTGADVGSLAGWTLQITTAADATITIPGPLSTNGGGVAGPYPVAIPVTGQTGTVTDVNLTLPGLTHTLPTDIDMLLVGPGGQKVLVMSDACGNDSNNATLILDDQAPVSLNSASGTCISGSYKPTNFGGADTFDAPAPVGPYADAMAAFNGGQANGTWLLFVRDDTVSYDTGWLLGAPTLTDHHRHHRRHRRDRPGHEDHQEAEDRLQALVEGQVRFERGWCDLRVQGRLEEVQAVQLAPEAEEPQVRQAPDPGARHRCRRQRRREPGPGQLEGEEEVALDWGRPPYRAAPAPESLTRSMVLTGH